VAHLCKSLYWRTAEHWATQVGHGIVAVIERLLGASNATMTRFRQERSHYYDDGPFETSTTAAIVSTLTVRQRAAAPEPRPEGTFREHEAIFRAIAAHEPDQAKREMANHLDRVSRGLHSFVARHPRLL
jgi:hypothetical protein